MPFPHIDPVFLRIGPLEFRWYGLMYILGFMAAYFIVLWRVRRRALSLTADDVADVIFYLAVGVILGGRFGYILFYNTSYYLEYPLKVFAVWEGGMSFHGGLIGVVLAGLLVARKKRLRFFTLADLCVLAVPVGLGLGRLGNFINGELYGRVTDLPWGVVFRDGGDMPRHPSQLYEAILEGPVLFAIVVITGRKERPEGVVFWTFIAFYGLFRFFVEFFREPDPQLGFLLGPFSMGQLLSFPMFLVGAAMVLICMKRGENAR